MKRSEIVVGRTYARDNASGTVTRRVVGDADSRNPRQRDDDQVQFVEARGDGTEAGPFTATRASFAIWAQREVTGGEPALGAGEA